MREQCGAFYGAHLLNVMLHCILRVGGLPSPLPGKRMFIGLPEAPCLLYIIWQIHTSCCIIQLVLSESLVHEIKSDLPRDRN